MSAETIFDLAGRKALVTGGTRGIGLGVATLLAGQGAQLSLGYLENEAAATAAAKRVAAAGGAEVGLFQGDLSAPETAQKVVDGAAEAMGGLDILVHSAGIRDDAPVLATSLERWERVRQTNLDSAFHVGKAAGRKMFGQGGRIIFMTSVSNHIGGPGQANYAAAKAGVEGLTRVMARELAPKDITVNSLCLGIIETDLTKEIKPDMREMFLLAIPCGRFGTVDEVAPVALLLASPAGSYVTGQVIHVNGGMVFGG